MSDIVVFEPEIYVVPVDPLRHKGDDLFHGHYDTETDPRIEKLVYRRPQKSEVYLRFALLLEDANSDDIRSLRLWRQHQKHAGLAELLLLGQYPPRSPRAEFDPGFRQSGRPLEPRGSSGHLPGSEGAAVKSTAP